MRRDSWSLGMQSEADGFVGPLRVFGGPRADRVAMIIQAADRTIDIEGEPATVGEFDLAPLETAPGHGWPKCGLAPGRSVGHLLVFHSARSRQRRAERPRGHAYSTPARGGAIPDPPRHRSPQPDPEGPLGAWHRLPGPAGLVVAEQRGCADHPLGALDHPGRSDRVTDRRCALRPDSDVGSCELQASHWRVRSALAMQGQRTSAPFR